MLEKKDLLKLFVQYKFIWIFFIFIFVPVFFMNNLVVFTPNDISIINDSAIYVGEGEPCESFYIKVHCLEGLTCTLTSSSGHRTGICMLEGTNLDEDNILRNPLIHADSSDIFREVDSLPVANVSVGTVVVKVN